MKKRNSKSIKPLLPKQLKKRCDPKNFDFETTEEIHQRIDIINQERAINALKFGIGMEKEGYNIFALGTHGIDKHSAIKKTLLKTQSKNLEPLTDWCYIYNFASPRYPILISLPVNTGKRLCDQMDSLVRVLQSKIPAIYESRAYKSELKKIQLRHESKKNKIVSDLCRQARKDGISINSKKNEFEILPIYQNKILHESEFQNLSLKQQKQFEVNVDKYLTKVEKLVDEISEIDEKHNDLIKELADNFIYNLIDEELEKIVKSYKDHDQLTLYFNHVKKDLIDNIKEFLPGTDKEKSPFSMKDDEIYTKFSRYKINLLVHHKNKKCPVIYESNPSYLNLIGRIEQISDQGLVFTNHMLIRSGALHRANHGYLLIDAHRLLEHPHAWEGLKHALYKQRIEINPLEQELGLSSSFSLEPENMPLNIKIILFGDNSTYQSLYYSDPDFKKLFNVVAEFDEELIRTKATEKKYTQMIASIIENNQLLPFHKNAVAKIIDFSSKMTGDATKLSVHYWAIKDLLYESNYWAEKAKKSYVDMSDVDKAKKARVNRSDQLVQNIKNQIIDNQILVDISGKKVGQINGLSVIQDGDFSFGQPLKITCTSRIGDGGIIDIEKEVELGGPIHSKGILILSGFLSGRYAKNYALSLSASIVIEQNYSSIDGDSASLAELCVLLSSISELPLKQSMAITGSINQFGDVQPIGGVNEKIEGFFDVCKIKGFQKDQGVIIPSSNVRHLMLKEEVIQKVKEGKFNIYAVSHVDEAMMLLTGIKPGKQNKLGRYPENTINFYVNQKLILYAQITKDEKVNT